MASPKVSLRITEDEKPEKSEFKIPQLLEVKRDGGEYTKGDVEALVNAICDGSMEDAQLGAFLMSVYLKGMTKLETASLTNAMKNSGTVFKWPPSWIMVDKHSTGGVGDKVSLALAPALASKGLKVPMISGRGLGHTGGTLDKLESIPGFKVCLTEDEMMTTLDQVGCCIVGQTKTLVPADKRMYAARDISATVSSMPLIVSSIISKKACESLHSLVLDVKFGCGTFMKSQFEAESLAKELVSSGNSLGMNTSAFVTDMNNPIGRKIGNSLEVEEALECLRGGGPQDLRELVLSLGAELLVSTGVSPSSVEGKSDLAKALDDGTALRIFSKMIECQGVCPSVCAKLCGEEFDYSCLPKSKFSTQVLSPESGYIKGINALVIAEVSFSLGAGRASSADPINYAVGLTLLKVVGDEVKEGEAWAEIKHDSPLEDGVIKKANSALLLSSYKTEKKSLIANHIINRPDNQKP